MLQKIIDSQNKIILPFANKPILIRVPIAILDQFDIADSDLWLFDPSSYQDTPNTYVYLRLFPEVTHEDVLLGESGYKNTFSQPSAYAISTKRRALTVTIRQSLKFIYDIIEKLIQISITSSFVRHSPIKIIDFTSPDAGQDYTIRHGCITITNPPVVVEVYGVLRCKSSWEFRFEEANIKI